MTTSRREDWDWHPAGRKHLKRFSDFYAEYAPELERPFAVMLDPIADVARTPEPPWARTAGNPNGIRVVAIRADLHTIPGWPDEADDLLRVVLSLPSGRLGRRRLAAFSFYLAAISSVRLS